MLTGTALEWPAEKWAEVWSKAKKSARTRQEGKKKGNGGESTAPRWPDREGKSGVRQ